VAKDANFSRPEIRKFAAQSQQIRGDFAIVIIAVEIAESCGDDGRCHGVKAERPPGSAASMTLQLTGTLTHTHTHTHECDKDRKCADNSNVLLELLLHDKFSF